MRGSCVTHTVILTANNRPGTSNQHKFRMCSTTTQVHNLHGMPGIVGALGGAISAASAGSNAYGESIGTVFPARAGLDGRTAG